jgi:signal transduction histidine kinase
VFSSGDKAHISVFNTGDPIPKENIPHIFERFYRVDKARSREKGGSGLGLSIAKRIIEQNEGSISVTSNEMNGTVFECSFKLSKTKKRDKKEDIHANK